MKVQKSAILALGIASLAFGSAIGQEHGGHIASCKTDYLRNKLWPTPFRSQDAIAVQTMLDIQRSNGWRLYNTLGTPMFDPNKNCLTDAGKAHIRWVLNNAPASRRVIFVLRGSSEQQTAQRVEATQLAISELIPTGTLPQIYLTDVEPVSSSGVYQTAIHRAMVESMPAPKLPEQNAGSTP